MLISNHGMSIETFVDFSIHCKTSGKTTLSETIGYKLASHASSVLQFGMCTPRHLSFQA